MEMSCITHSRMALWDLDLAPRTVVKWLQSSTKLMPMVFVGGAGERVGVEEDPIADSSRGAGGYAGSEERLHEVDICTD
jgi:hypothetical protein